MSTEEYEAWVNHHRALFQLNSTADTAMFAAWWPLLWNYEHDELIEASNHIAITNGGLWRTEHLSEIRQRVTGRRLERFRLESEQQQQQAGYMECGLCRGLGWVVVPHPNFIINRAWQPVGNSWPTASVYCQCSKGARRAEHARAYAMENPKVKLPAMLTLAGYEQKNPNWAQQMADRENAEKDEAHAKTVAQHAHTQQGAVDLRGILRRLTAAAKAINGEKE